MNPSTSLRLQRRDLLTGQIYSFTHRNPFHWWLNCDKRCDEENYFTISSCYSLYDAELVRVFIRTLPWIPKMNRSKVQINYIKFYPLWVIVPFVCIQHMNEAKAAKDSSSSGRSNNKHPSTFTDKNSISKIKSCQFGWLLLLLSSQTN